MKIRTSPQVSSQHSTPATVTMSPENADPLAGLDSVDWSQLSHAPGTLDRESLLYLITSLAIGHPDWAVPKGIDIHNWEKGIAETEKPEYRDPAMQELRAYKAVERGLSSIVRCLDEDSASMRADAAHAAHALAFFPRQSAISRVALLNRLSEDTNNNVGATIILSLAVLFARRDDDTEKRDLIQNIQEYHSASPVPKASDDIFGWSCAVAIFILGSKEDGLADTVQRICMDKAYVDKLESTLDQDVWFPFASLDLRDLAKSVLEN
ncbi:hypothetical protein FCIRC_1389 [Fusarium circinatum]|uniref:Uncharacterized protein n=1 Tax=Fusarium circinatum TaxID=48490 RepID=A0A8H5XAJ3_FUSCI|nr:hypothetical protein FCIRC_1389 [Fusarium circinatum]